MDDGLFDAFDAGELRTPALQANFAERPWNPHSAFAGVELKHLITGAESGGLFSYHLVRIAPGMAIGNHIHDPQVETHEVAGGDGLCNVGGESVAYRPGVIAIMPPRVGHSVTAGANGLKLLAKFMPPLC